MAGLALPKLPEFLETKQSREETLTSKLEAIRENVDRYKELKNEFAEHLTTLGFDPPIFLLQYPENWNYLEREAENLIDRYDNLPEGNTPEREFTDQEKAITRNLYPALVPEARAEAMRSINKNRTETEIGYYLVNSTPTAEETWGTTPEGEINDSRHIEPYAQYAVGVMDTLINRESLTQIDNPIGFPIRSLYVSGAATDKGGEFDNGTVYIYYFPTAGFDEALEGSPDWFLWDVVLHESFHGMFPSAHNVWMELLTPVETLSAWTATAKAFAVNQEYINRAYGWIKENSLYQNLPGVDHLYSGVGARLLRKILIEQEWESGNENLDNEIYQKIIELGEWDENNLPNFRAFENEWFLDNLLAEEKMKELGVWALDNFWRNPSFREALGWDQEEIFINHFHYDEVFAYGLTDVIMDRDPNMPQEFIDLTNTILALGRNTPPLTVERLRARITQLIRQSGLEAIFAKVSKARLKERKVVPEPKFISGKEAVRKIESKI